MLGMIEKGMGAPFHIGEIDDPEFFLERLVVPEQGMARMDAGFV